MTRPSMRESSPAERPARTQLLEYLHACPVCFGEELRHYCRVPSLFHAGEFIRYDRCAECGTALRNPRLPPEQRLSKYEDQSVGEERLRLQPKSQVHYACMMRLIERFLPAASGRRLLDFGCGSGGFLVEAREAGFEVAGLELNRALADHVERVHGIPVHQGLISDPGFAARRFHVVLSSQVFEHLLDPRATLLELREHLDPPGIVLIEVPNLLSLQERLRRGSTMDDTHLFYFTGRSLGRMMRDLGFDVLAVQQGVRPWRFLGDRARRIPLGLLSSGERVASVLQVRSGLSVLARLRPGPPNPKA